MTKTEYELAKAGIIQAYGKPEYDMKEAINESAKRLEALKMAYIRQPKTEKEQLTDIVKDVSKKQIMAVQGIALPDLQIDERYLTAFNDVEKKLLHDHFNTNLSNKELGIRYQLSSQAVTALLNDTRVKVLEARLFDSLAPWRTRLALMRLVEANDSKVTLRLAEHFGVVKSEAKDLNLNTKPLDDPKAIAMLKELGDKLIDAQNE